MLPDPLAPLRWWDSLNVAATRVCCPVQNFKEVPQIQFFDVWDSSSWTTLAYGPDSAEICLEVRGGSEDHRDFTAAVH